MRIVDLRPGTKDAGCWIVLTLSSISFAMAQDELPRAYIDGQGADWQCMTEEDFVNVNCDPDTWTWEDGTIHCSGEPTGVLRSKHTYTNFELVLQWRHLQPGGNSGVFVWVAEKYLEGLTRNGLPSGIEVQALDHEFLHQFERQTKQKVDSFTTHGDVFPVGKAKMTPFPPVAPTGYRSFPSKHLSKGAGSWNHYYIRCINGEIRLWVNGEEVSGGTNCEPRQGFLALESEGAPIDFKEVKIRKLP